jgi:hypothetical protein
MASAGTGCVFGAGRLRQGYDFTSAVRRLPSSAHEPDLRDLGRPHDIMVPIPHSVAPTQRFAEKLLPRPAPGGTVF